MTSLLVMGWPPTVSVKREIQLPTTVGVLDGAGVVAAMAVSSQ